MKPNIPQKDSLLALGQNCNAINSILFYVVLYFCRIILFLSVVQSFASVCGCVFIELAFHVRIERLFLSWLATEIRLIIYPGSINKFLCIAKINSHILLNQIQCDQFIR